MHKKAFTPDNAAMLLIDHQVGTMGWTHSHDINLVKKNALRLARIAKAFGMPWCSLRAWRIGLTGRCCRSFKKSSRKRRRPIPCATNSGVRTSPEALRRSLR